MTGQGKGFVRKEKFNTLRRRVEALEAMFSTLSENEEAGEKSPVLKPVAEEVATEKEIQNEVNEETEKIEYTYDEVIELLELKGVEYDKRIKNVDKLKGLLEEADG
jgi:hypothetical protein